MRGEDTERHSKSSMNINPNSTHPTMSGKKSEHRRQIKYSELLLVVVTVVVDGEENYVKYKEEEEETLQNF